MSVYLKIDWIKHRCTVLRCSERELDVDKDLLDEVKDENVEIVKANTVGVDAVFLKAMVEVTEADGDEEEDEIEISDWELIT